MSEKCLYCGSDCPEQFKYCSACGASLKPDTLSELAKRVIRLEAVKADRSTATTEQKLAEYEITDLIWTRLLKRSAAAIILLFVIVGLITGYAINNIYDLAAQAHKAIDPLIAQAKGEAAKAQGTAAEALRNSNKVKALTDSTKTEIDSLKTRVLSQSIQVKQLGEHVELLQVTQTTQTVLRDFPILGGRFVRAASGSVLDAARKKPNQLYVLISITSVERPLFTAETLAHIENSLQNEGIIVFHKAIYLETGTPTEYEPIAAFGVGDCQPIFAVTIKPCILYFKPTLKDRAQKLRTELRPLQHIADDHISYGALGRFHEIQQEILRKSGLDLLVILGD